MSIQYQFNLEKAVAAMAAFIHRVGPMDKLKLVKLLYLADKHCFLNFGHPITGDRQCAMNHGPVPSDCLNVLNGDVMSSVFSYLHVQDIKVTPDCNPPPLPNLVEEEEKSIEAIINDYGSWSTGKLYKFVHDLPEYKDTWVPNTSTTIPYEKMLQYSGSESHFRLGKPVISRAMRRHLPNPFPNETN